MRKITLVCSAHNPNGLCNANELLKILCTLNPDVIFQELRPGEFDLLYRQGGNEPLAVKKYREIKTIKEIPVDQFDMPHGLVEAVTRVFDYVADTNQEFDFHKTKEESTVSLSGFRFLNSAFYQSLMTRLRLIEDTVIAATGDQRMIRTLAMWRQFNLNREREMVRNIYEYSRTHDFDSGVFLVGASHKSGLIKEIEKYSTTEAELIHWNLAYGQNP